MTGRPQSRRHVRFDRFELCLICGRSITSLQARMFKTCDGWRCRSEYRKQQRLLRQEEDRRFQQMHAQRLAAAAVVREKQAVDSMIDNPCSYPIVVVSANTRRLVPLTRTRRRQLAGQMQRLVEEAWSIPPDRASADAGEGDGPADLPPAFGVACGTCRGHCCLNGGTHAYLHRETITRYRSAHPEAGPQDAVQSYLRHLPAVSYADSCVFHAESGCALPRGMRSSTCNGSMCSGLIELRDAIERLRWNRCYLAAMHGDQLIRGSFLRWPTDEG